MLRKHLDKCYRLCSYSVTLIHNLQKNMVLHDIFVLKLLLVFCYVQCVCTDDEVSGSLSELTRKINLMERLLLAETAILKIGITQMTERMENIEERLIELDNEIHGMQKKKVESESSLTEQELINRPSGILGRRIETLSRGLRREKMLNARSRREVVEMKRTLTNSIQETRNDMLDSFTTMYRAEREYLASLVRNESKTLKVNIDTAHNETKDFLRSVTYDRCEAIIEQLLPFANKTLAIVGETSVQVSTKTQNCSKLFEQEGISQQAGRQYESCQELQNHGIAKSGVYNVVYPSRKSTISVFCDMDTDLGGWTVIQRRKDGSEDFSRTWAEYQVGFGNIDKEFWLGNELLYQLTSDQDQELRIDLEDDTRTYFVKYRNFRLSSEADGYRLYISGYSGDVYDMMAYHNGSKFSAKDRDEDNSSGFCAGYCKGGWWYNRCYNANFNWVYGEESVAGIRWHLNRESTRQAYAKMIEMKIRPRKEDYGP